MKENIHNYYCKLLRYLTATLSAFALCLSSFGQNQEVKSKNWISISYTKCLEKQLPCECQRKEVHSLIRLDTIKSLATIYDGIIYDPNTFKLKKEINNSCQVYYTKYITEKFRDSVFAMGTIQIINDTLFYSDNNKQSKTAFISYGAKGDDEWTYSKENIILLNKAFLKRNYPTLEIILDTDSLICDCNPELGVINIISDGKHSWIIEQNSDTIFIFEWTNIPDRKTISLKIEKKLIKQYKW